MLINVVFRLQVSDITYEVVMETICTESPYNSRKIIMKLVDRNIDITYTVNFCSYFSKLS